jgi:hypothetical protein
MFGSPIDRITFAHIDAFCRSGVRESIVLDFKKDFPSRLEKTIAAFSNTYGGIILIGVDETAQGEAVTPICGVQLMPGLRERVIQTGLDAVYPPVVPEVKVVDFKSSDGLSESDRAVVVVRVHESDTGGHAVDKRTTVYLRVDNVSDPFRKATLGELGWFFNKRDKALQEKNRILELSREHANQYLIRLRTRHGMAANEPTAKCVFWTIPRFPRNLLARPQQLLEYAREVRTDLQHARHLFPLGSIMPVREGIFFDGDYSVALRYTEIQQQGLMYSECGFWWDRREAHWSEYVFPPSIAELIVAGLHVSCKLYGLLGYWGLVDFEFSLVGIKGRKFREPMRGSSLGAAYGATDDQITVRESASVPEWTANGIEIVRRLMTDMAWAFGVQDLPNTVVKYLDVAII